MSNIIFTTQNEGGSSVEEHMLQSQFPKFHQVLAAPSKMVLSIAKCCLWLDVCITYTMYEKKEPWPFLHRAC